MGWVVRPSTVVLARVPESVRVVRTLTIRPRSGEPTAASGADSPDGVGDRLLRKLGFMPPGEEEVVRVGRQVTVPLDPPSELADRYSIVVWAGDAGSGRLRELFRPRLVRALLAAPEGLSVELRDGQLELHVDDYLEDPERLEALCRAGSELAASLEAVAATLPRLDPRERLASPAADEDRPWIDERLSHVHWSQPPADVPTAAATCRGVAGKSPRLRTATQKALGAILRFTLLVALIVAPVVAVPLLAGLLFGATELLVGALLVGGLLFGLGLLMAVRLLWKAPRLIRELAIPRLAETLGAEAFAREYARSRRLTLEDPNELRVRLRSPLPGAPLRAFHGPLGDRVVGHLAIWIDTGDLTDTVRHNVAVIPAAGPRPQASPGYEAFTVDGSTIVAERVDRAGRSLERLDALRAETARIAQGRQPAASPRIGEEVNR